MILKPGTRLISAVCTTSVMVVKATADDVDLRCGGAPIAAAGTAPSGEPQPGFDTGTQIGKRYTDESGELELLCTKAGAGSLSIGDTLLVIKEAKSMPTSD
jgi:hypothetical protein